MDAQALRTDLRTFVADNFLYDDASSLADDASLVGSGLLDSTGVLELISHLEGELGFEFRDDELVGANFESIDRIVAFLSGRDAEGRAAR